MDIIGYKHRTVDSTGKVTAISTGTATITATTVDDNKTASCEVTADKPVILLIDDLIANVMQFFNYIRSQSLKISWMGSHIVNDGLSL